MRNRWKHSLIAAAACAVLAAGCGGDKATDYRAAQDAGSSSERISLTGCVETAPGRAGEFALQHVRLQPLGEQPSDALTATSGQPITEGSWVRLAMADEAQLRERVGERVTIVGTIRDDGRDRVGTGGPQPAPQEPDPRPQESRAGAEGHHSEKVAQEVGAIGQQSMATGYAPLVMVQQIEGAEGSCGPTAREPRDQ
jgi:hypothetical protein